MSSGAVIPYPYSRLPALSRVELQATAKVRRPARTHRTLVDEVLGDLVGEPVAITVRTTSLFDAGRSPQSSVGVMLGPVSALGLDGAVLVEAESALVLALVARSLKQRAPRITDASRVSANAAVAGAFGALVHAIARRIVAGSGGDPMRVLAAGPARALGGDLARAFPKAATAWLKVTLGGEAFEARLTLPVSESEASRSDAHSSFTRADLAQLGDTPLALPLVMTSCLCRRRDLGLLGTGDVFVLPSSRERLSSGRIVGPVVLVAPRSERGLEGNLADDGRLVLRTVRTVSQPWDRPGGTFAMTNQDPATAEPNATLEALEDAPVVVRVELGVVELPAGAWATLGDGDVLTLGRKLGEPVVLRVAGVEVARGELVQVEGEIGVRILGRGDAPR